MREHDFDLLVAEAPEGVDLNPHPSGSNEHEEWAKQHREAIGRLEKAHMHVASWNRSHAVGDAVLYTKGDLEGCVILRTASLAYVFGPAAVVDLEHIGVVKLEKLGPAPR